MHYVSHHRVNAELTYELYMVEWAIQGSSVLTEWFWSLLPQGHMFDVIKKNLLLFCLHFKCTPKCFHLLAIFVGPQKWYVFGCNGSAENHGVIKGACPALRADLESLIRAGHHMKIPEGKFIYSAFTSTYCNPWCFLKSSEHSSQNQFMCIQQTDSFNWNALWGELFS